MYDSSKERHAKYGLPSHSHLRAVQKAHAQARHDIDATALDAAVLGEDFDFVVFNFPHVGSDTGACVMRVVLSWGGESGC